MSHAPLDDKLVELMEQHCQSYRVLYGHLRRDGKGDLEPIPFPDRTFPSYLWLKSYHDRDLGMWFQMEKILGTHRNETKSQPAIVTGGRRFGKGTLMPPGFTHDHRTIYDPTLPARSDIGQSWRQVSLKPTPGGRVDRSDAVDSIAAAFSSIGNAGRIMTSIIGGFRKSLYSCWDVSQRMVEDALDERRHSTDYPRKKGWYAIPHQVPCPEKPAPVLLALLKRAQT